MFRCFRALAVALGLVLALAGDEAQATEGGDAGAALPGGQQGLLELAPFALLEDHSPLRVGRVRGAVDREYRVQQCMHTGGWGGEVWLQADQRLTMVPEGRGHAVRVEPRLVDVYAVTDFGRVPDADLDGQVVLPVLSWTEDEDGLRELQAEGGRTAEFLQAALGPSGGMRIPRPPAAVERGGTWEDAQEHEQILEIEDRRVLLHYTTEARYDFLGWFERGGSRYALIHSQAEVHARVGAGTFQGAILARGSGWVALEPETGLVAWTAGQLHLVQGDARDERPDRVRLHYALGPLPEDPDHTSLPPRIPQH